MTDYDRDRGAYTPSGEAPLAFDPRSQGGRSAGRPPIALIISALILLVLMAAVFIYYRSGVRHAGEPPVVGQQLGDIKQAAPASSQPTDEAAGLSIYKAEQNPSASSAPTFAPPPEQPEPLPAAPAARVQAAALPPAALKGPAAPGPTAASPDDNDAAPEAALATPPARPAPAKAAEASAPPATGGGKLVQIGAYSSKPLAEKGWNDIARLMPGDMVGRTESFEPVSKDGQTLYRAYIGGFASKADAQGFCEKLKAQGHSCMVK
jgi:hypothetical protein